MKDRKIQLPQELFDLVLKHFNGDQQKTWIWFQTPNPSLSHQSPFKMIKDKKIKKVIQFALKQMSLF